MQSDGANRVGQWLLPICIVYAVIWITWWGYRLTVGGGLDSASEVVTMVVSGVSGTLGLILGWQMRRHDRATR
jgi:hypothetical protein